MNKLHRTGTG